MAVEGIGNLEHNPCGLTLSGRTLNLPAGASAPGIGKRRQPGGNGRHLYAVGAKQFRAGATAQDVRDFSRCRPGGPCAAITPNIPFVQVGLPTAPRMYLPHHVRPVQLRTWASRIRSGRRTQTRLQTRDNYSRPILRGKHRPPRQYPRRTCRKKFRPSTHRSQRSD